MKYLFTLTAALSMVATPILAQGNGNGRGNGNGNAAEKAQGARSDRGPSHAASNDDRKDDGAERRGGKDRPERPHERTARDDRSIRGSDDANPADKTRKKERRAASRDYDSNDGRFDRSDDANRDRGRERYAIRLDDRGGVRFDDELRRSFADGCPPGLAKKRNGCTPPGQMTQRRDGFASDFLPSLLGLSAASSYFYDDGYLLRYGQNGVSSYLPLLGGALSIGNSWPSDYRYGSVPDYYIDYLNLGGRDNHRFADNVVYRVDPETTAIQSVAAILTGNDITVGQPMPAGYDVYNVPTGYRDRYRDGPDARYRYSDGYVYRIDPTTRLVSAAIDLLV